MPRSRFLSRFGVGPISFFTLLKERVKWGLELLKNLLQVSLPEAYILLLHRIYVLSGVISSVTTFLGRLCSIFTKFNLRKNEDEFWLITYLSDSNPLREHKEFKEKYILEITWSKVIFFIYNFIDQIPCPFILCFQSRKIQTSLHFSFA